MRAVGGDCRAHGSAQALGGRARMTAIAGRAVGGAAQRDVEHRVHNVGMQGVDGAVKRRQGAVAGAGQRLGQMARGAEDRLAAVHDVG